jgi:hypothetical protein
MIDTHALNRGPLGVCSPADLVQQDADGVSGSENHCETKAKSFKMHCQRRLHMPLPRIYPASWKGSLPGAWLPGQSNKELALTGAVYDH